MLICKKHIPATDTNPYVGEILQIEKSGSTVNVKIKGTDFDFTFDAALVSSKPDVMFLNRDTVGQPTFTWLSQVGNSADGYLSSRVAKRIHQDSICLALFGVDAEGGIYVYSLRMVHGAVGFDSIVEVGFNDPKSGKQTDATDVLMSNATSSGTLAHYASASLKAFIHHMHLKQSTSNKLSTTRALDALERQVDLLTHLVVALATQAGISTNGLAEVLDVASADPSAAEKSIARVIAYKDHVRNVAQAHGEAVKAIYSATE